MEWLKKFLENKLLSVLSISSLISLFIFLANLIAALRDGILSDSEVHTLMSGASGLQLLILGAVMVVLKIKK